MERDGLEQLKLNSIPSTEIGETEIIKDFDQKIIVEPKPPTTQSGSTASQSSESNLKVLTAKDPEVQSENSSEEENFPIEKSP